MFNQSRSGNVSVLRDIADWGFSFAANATVAWLALISGIAAGVIAILRHMYIKGMQDNQRLQRKARGNKRR